MHLLHSQRTDGGDKAGLVGMSLTERKAPTRTAREISADLARIRGSLDWAVVRAYWNIMDGRSQPYRVVLPPACVTVGWQLCRVGRALVVPGWLCTAQPASTASPHSGQRNGLRLALDRKKA